MLRREFIKLIGAVAGIGLVGGAVKAQGVRHISKTGMGKDRVWFDPALEYGGYLRPHTVASERGAVETLIQEAHCLIPLSHYHKVCYFIVKEINGVPDVVVWRYFPTLSHQRKYLYNMPLNVKKLKEKHGRTG